MCCLGHPKQPITSAEVLKMFDGDKNTSFVVSLASQSVLNVTTTFNSSRVFESYVIGTGMELSSVPFSWTVYGTSTHPPPALTEAAVGKAANALLLSSAPTTANSISTPSPPPWVVLSTRESTRALKKQGTLYRFTIPPHPTSKDHPQRTFDKIRIVFTPRPNSEDEPYGEEDANGNTLEYNPFRPLPFEMSALKLAAIEPVVKTKTKVKTIAKPKTESSNAVITNTKLTPSKKKSSKPNIKAVTVKKKQTSSTSVSQQKKRHSSEQLNDNNTSSQKTSTMEKLKTVLKSKSKTEVKPTTKKTVRKKRKVSSKL